MTVPAAAFRAVSFDVHGTLIVPHPSVGAVYAAEAAAHGLERSPAALDAAFVPAFRSFAGGWAVPYGRDERDARRFWDAVIDATFGEPVPGALRRALFERFGRGAAWRVLPGAREALAIVRGRGLPCYACTNFDGRVRAVLRDLGLDAFDALFLSAEVGAAKPDPAVLRAAAAHAGCRTPELLHVGDHEREDAGACAASGAAWLRVAQPGGVDVDRLAAVLDGRLEPDRPPR